MWDQGYWRSQEQYLELFRAAKSATILGEASTNYTKLPLVSGVPEKLHQFNPDARLVYVMRDPIRRTISHYWHSVRYNAEYRSLLHAIEQEPQYCDVSYYAMQLKPFFTLFRRAQIKLLTFEELIGNTNETIGALYRWLNLDASIAASAAIEPENVTPESIDMAIWFALLQRLRQLPLLRGAVSHVPVSVRRVGVRLATRNVIRRDVDVSEVIKYLRPLQRRQTQELSELTGRTFPEWTTLTPRESI
jgi:hypothetical protein